MGRVYKVIVGGNMGRAAELRDRLAKQRLDALNRARPQ